MKYPVELTHYKDRTYLNPAGTWLQLKHPDEVEVEMGNYDDVTDRISTELGDYVESPCGGFLIRVPLAEN